MNPTAEAVSAAPSTTPIRDVGEAKPAWWQVAVIGGLVLALYMPVLRKLVYDWSNDANFSHGFFVPLFTAYLLWANRRRLAALPLRGSWGGAAVIAASVFILVCGTLGADLLLPRLSFVGTLAGLVVLFAGWRWFRQIFWAWAFLFLMIPLPAILMNQVTFPLQLLASKLASGILPIFGVPVLRDGNVIRLPSMPLEVAEACSGIRSLLSLTTLALIYGYFMDDKAWRRALLAVAAIPIAVVANACRVVGTGLAVQYWDPDKALGFFHEFSGWVIFMVSLLLLLGVHGAGNFLGRRWGRKAA